MRAPHGGPNSFIFMEFSGKKLKNNSTYWELAPPPPGKILDPPLHCQVDCVIMEKFLGVMMESICLPIPLVVSII